MTNNALLFLTLIVPALTPGMPAPVAQVSAEGPAAFCGVPSGPEFYGFELSSTKNIPGTGTARARAEVSFPPASPFPVAVSSDGSYVYHVDISIERMRPPDSGRLVAWLTTPDLDRVERLTAFDENLRAGGPVSWNKFLVVVTLEPADAPDGDRWSGPVVFRGMSRSGAMHTMLGHGALQQENCASYGFGS
ncbi:MAG: hypothetical protein U5R14_02125 [Gemmatimonadota bacterium]|nr:hypothetical protein [Gemmatimonadota bacterium]